MFKFKLPKGVVLDERMRDLLMQPWLNAAFTLRVFTDAETFLHGEQLYACISYGRLVVQRLHADIYDEMCRIYIHEQNMIGDIIGPVSQVAAFTYSTQAYVATSVMGEIVHSVTGSLAGREAAAREAEAAKAVGRQARKKLNNIPQAISTFFANIRDAFTFVHNLTLDQMYPQAQQGIEPVYMLPLAVAADRPYISNSADKNAYPVPLQLAFQEFMQNVDLLNRSGDLSATRRTRETENAKNCITQYLKGALPLIAEWV